MNTHISKSLDELCVFVKRIIEHRRTHKNGIYIHVLEEIITKYKEATSPITACVYDDKIMFIDINGKISLVYVLERKIIAEIGQLSVLRDMHPLGACVTIKKKDKEYVLLEDALTRGIHLSDSMEVLQVRTGSMTVRTAKGKEHEFPRFCSVVVIGPDTIMICGGTDQDKNGSVETWIIHRHADNKKRVRDMNIGRFHHAAALLNDGRIIVSGGYNKRPLSSCEIYDPTSDTWTLTANLPEERLNHNMYVINTEDDCIIRVTGGRNHDETLQERDCVFDNEIGEWKHAKNENGKCLAAFSCF